MGNCKICGVELNALTGNRVSRSDLADARKVGIALPDDLCYGCLGKARSGEQVWDDKAQLQSDSERGNDAHANIEQQPMKTSLMTICGIFLLLCAVILGVAAAKQTLDPLAIKYGNLGIQEIQKATSAFLLLSGLSGVSFLSGLVLTAVGVAMDKVMKKNAEILSAIKRLSAGQGNNS